MLEFEHRMDNSPRVRVFSTTFVVGFGFGAFLGVALAILAVALVQDAEPQSNNAQIPTANAQIPTAIPRAGASQTPTPDEAVRTRQALDVRIGPGDVFAVIGVLSRGVALDVVGRDEAAAWLAIRFPPGSAGRGWVPVDAVDGLSGVDGLVVALPTQLPRAVFTTPTFGGTAVSDTPGFGPPAAGATGTPTPSGPPDLTVTSLTRLPDGRVEVVIANLGPGELDGLLIFVRVNDLSTVSETIVSPPTRLAVGDSITLETTRFTVPAPRAIQATVDPFSSGPDADRSNNFLQLTLSPPPTPTRTPTREPR